MNSLESLIKETIHGLETGRFKKVLMQTPQAIVYELKEEGRPTLFFQQGDDNILFFLDKDRKLLVGNRDFSYTLNRKVK